MSIYISTRKFKWWTRTGLDLNSQVHRYVSSPSPSPSSLISSPSPMCSNPSRALKSGLEYCKSEFQTNSKITMTRGE